MGIGLIVILTALAASAAPASTRDSAGNRMEVMQSVPVITTTTSDSKDSGASPELFCTKDQQWCAMVTSSDVVKGAPVLQLFDGRVPISSRSTISADLPMALETTFAIWPNIVREAPSPDQIQDPAVIVAVRSSVSTMYSGGGGSAGRLFFYRVVGKTMSPVLDVDVSGSKMIRACFSEKDTDYRRGACHDEYNYDATISLVPTTKRGMPVFSYVTSATAFPAGASQDNDSTTRGRLNPSDIRTGIDAICTYRRIIRYNPPTQHYEFDRPGPDCSDFTIP